MEEKDIRIKQLEDENLALREKIARLSIQSQEKSKWSQRVIDSLPNPVFIKNSHHEFVSCNKAFAELLGVTVAEIIGKTDYDFTPKEESDVFWKKDSEVLENNVSNWNEENHTRGGITKSLLTSKTRIEDDAGNFYVLGAIADITDNKNQHTLLKKKKREIEQQKIHIQTLLKEVHHRVKNNLQIINSLLNLQLSKHKDPQLELIIENARNRIYSMAKIHEILCESDSLSAINMNAYINSLVENLKLTVGSEKNTRIDIESPSVFFNVETAIPIGLIINETVTNAIKYGQKKDNETLDIYIELKRFGNTYTLSIGDNGQNVDQNTFTPNLGSELIEIFCDQIDGELSIPNKTAGVHYAFKFNLD